jgi:hypothetical protein
VNFELMRVGVLRSERAVNHGGEKQSQNGLSQKQRAHGRSP